MTVTIGDRLIRKADGKVFTVKHIGSWAGDRKRRMPLFDGQPVKLTADDGEEQEFAHVQGLNGLFDKPR